MATLSDMAKSAGVIGAGGAGFPTHVKLATPVDTILVNGAECEPLMSGDEQTMESKACDMVSALRLVIAEFDGKIEADVKAIIGVKKKYEGAMEAIGREIKDTDPIEILALDNVYPAGDEQFLVYEATGRIVPEGGIPPQVGCLVMNVGTLCHLYDAVNGKAVTERFMTLGGAVRNPKVVSVPIGTSFAEIISAVEPSIDDYVLLVNGPLMGRISTDISEVTTKTMGGVFILPKGHSHVMRMSRPLSTEIRLSKSACEACGYCTDYCPRYLQGHDIEPEKIMRVINYDRDLDTKTITSAWLCCECGVCDLWACPMFLSPRIIFKEFKQKLKDAGIKNPNSRVNPEVDPNRKYRGVPLSRLVTRLGLSEYDKRPPFDNTRFSPTSVTIKLNQHIGAPSVPTVSKNEKVSCGDLIAGIPEGALGATYHASIDGVVDEVTKEYIRIVN